MLTSNMLFLVAVIVNFVELQVDILNFPSLSLSTHTPHLVYSGALLCIQSEDKANVIQHSTAGAMHACHYS